MRYDPDRHHRRSIRLKGFDYSSVGAYFVTVCVQGRRGLFGELVDGKMHLSPAGEMVLEVWNQMPEHYPGVGTDAFVGMPNHIHGIIVLGNVGAAPRGRPDPRGRAGVGGQAQGPAPTGLTLPDVVHRFKTLTTSRYVRGVKESGWPPFDKRLWQRNYYERVIRDEDELRAIREYIVHNPLGSDTDEENPHR